MTNAEKIKANKAKRAELMAQWDVTGVKPEAELAANLDELEALCAGHKGRKAAKHCNDEGLS